MLIDWFTVVAQAVNFLVLVWLMKRFLYQPIIKALDAREQRIAAELTDADNKKKEAEAEREAFKRKNEEIDSQHDGMMSQAANDADAERSRLMEAARNDAQDLRNKLNDKLANEYRNLHDEIARRTQAEVFAIARKALGDLSGNTLEERIVEVFLQRLREMDDSELSRLASVATKGEAVIVRSAFELSAAQHTSVEQAIRAAFGSGNPVRFDIVPNLIGGIELVLRGEKVAWSISDHLASLEKELAELLKAQRHES
jgi:F-type H+-transporting ATPase subunit b